MGLASIEVAVERKKGQTHAPNAGDSSLSQRACGGWDGGTIGGEWRAYVLVEQSGLGGMRTVGRRRSSSSDFWVGSISQDGGADGQINTRQKSFCSGD